MSEEEFREMLEELGELQQRVNVLTQARASGGDGEVDEEVRERVERLETRVANVQSQAGGGEGGEGVTPRQVAEAPAVKTIEKRVAVLEEDMVDLEEYMYEWHEAAETYMRALRRVVEDKLGVSLQSYLETGEGELESDEERRSQ